VDAEVKRLIESIHAAPAQAALVLTGGGASAAAELLAVPGGSRTILEVAVPYHENALVEYLGFRPQHFCNRDTAAAMAERALDRARHLAPGHAVVGLGCTAGLVTDRPKKGEHRFYVAAATEEGTTVCWAILEKGARGREGEETLVATVMLNQLAQAFAITERVPLSLRPGETLQTESIPARNLLVELHAGRLQRICVEPDGRMVQHGEPPKALLPGAFNPLHVGHVRLAEVAARRAGGPAAFELSIVNVDKPPLAIAEIRHRLVQFEWLAPVWLSRAPLFVEKAALFPGVTFVVGFDTAERIVAPRYYGDNAEKMRASLEQIRRQGCRFLVAGRRDQAGEFRQLQKLALPGDLQDLFSAIPEAEFHIDLSSTELREKEGRTP
jgi:nicotinamide mononucleotide (NMN) deamidase PncC